MAVVAADCNGLEGMLVTVYNKYFNSTAQKAFFQAFWS